MEGDDITQVLVVGDELFVKMYENPSTGFVWTPFIPEYNDYEDIIEFVSTEYERPQTNMMGAKGLRTFSFNAKYEGSLDLEFVNARI